MRKEKPKDRQFSCSKVITATDRNATEEFRGKTATNLLHPRMLVCVRFHATADNGITTNSHSHTIATIIATHITFHKTRLLQQKEYVSQLGLSIARCVVCVAC